MAQTVFHGAPAGTAQAVCVFTHGRGQSPEEMIETVVARIDAPGVLFALPRAPRDAWYDARAVDPLSTQTRTQLDAALDQLGQTIAASRTACPGVPVVVAGFSQGACLSAEYLLRGGAADAGVLLTGCRIGASDDDLPTAALPHLPVYASNSDDDPWIALDPWQQMVTALARAGARLRCDVLPGRDHAVSDAECAVVSDMLARLIRRQPLWQTPTAGQR